MSPGSQRQQSPGPTQQIPLGGGESESADELLARGRLVLQSLVKQAEAARAEARKAELEIVLAAAYQGDTTRLSAWLSENDALTSPGLEAEGSLCQSNPCQSNPSRRTVGRQAIADDSSTCGKSDWEQYASHSARRLEAKARELLVPASSHEGPPEVCSADILSCESRAGKTLDPTTHATTPRDEQKMQALAQSLDGLQEEQAESQRRFSLFSRLGGVLASILVHVLLIIVLAVVTLKMPSPPSGLAFESASAQAVEQTLELTQAVEASVPEVSEASQESNLDIANELSDVDSSMVDVLGEAALVSNSANSALAASALGSAAANPRNATASFFGAAANGNCFCYVIDSSGSMRGGPWEAAKLELLKSLSSLEPKQRFYIIFFNRELSAVPLPGERDPAPSALYANQENLAHARRWIDTIKIGIGAPPNNALELAIRKEPDAVYLLTDGVTTVDVAKFLRERNRIRDFVNGEQILVPIHAIAFYSLKGQDLLRQIASENRGQFIYVPDPMKR